MAQLGDSRRAVACLLDIAAAIGTIAFGSTGVAATPPRAPEKIYNTTCGYCHGAHVGPIIRGRNLPPELVAQIVRMGPNAMPAFRPTEITDAELKSLAQWISNSKADPKEKGE